MIVGRQSITVAAQAFLVSPQYLAIASVMLSRHAVHDFKRRDQAIWSDDLQTQAMPLA